MAEEGRAETIIRWVAFVFAVIAVLGAGFVYASLILTSWVAYSEWPKLFETHFAAIIPGAAAAAFVLVVLLRQTEGPIEFEVSPVKFKGASGQIVLWAICFLSIAAAIKMLW
jgi:hypothetical protein